MCVKRRQTHTRSGDESKSSKINATTTAKRCIIANALLTSFFCFFWSANGLVKSVKCCNPVFGFISLSVASYDLFIFLRSVDHYNFGFWGGHCGDDCVHLSLSFDIPNKKKNKTTPLRRQKRCLNSTLFFSECPAHAQLFHLRSKQIRTTATTTTTNTKAYIK